MSKIRRSLGLGAVTVLATMVPAGIAGALQTPTTGQPGTTQGFNCGTTTAPTEPGNAANAPGSAFNETLPGHAGTMYAGNGPGSTQHAGSTAAVSQYDSACRQLSSH
jgi:hypothetical protein